MNKKTKKMIAMVLAMATSATAFVGCANKEGTPKAPETPKKEDTQKEAAKPETAEKTVLKVTTWTDEMEAMKVIEKSFEAENPDIDVEIVEFPSEEYQDKLIIQLAGGADIDVMQMKNTADYSDIATKNQLVDLEPMVKADNMDIVPYGPLYEGLKIDKQLFGLPYRKTAWALFYNKTLFDEKGVAYPTQDITWDQFRELAKQMSSGSGNEKVWGAYLHTWPQTWYGMGLQSGATIIDQDLTPFAHALQFRMDLEADGSIMPFVEAKATNAHYKTEFAKGMTAMNIIGDFHIQQLRDLEKEGEISFDWDIVPMPHPEGVGANTTWGTANPIGISKNSKNQEAAWKFVKYTAGKEGSKVYADLGRLPAYVDDEVKSLFVGDGSQKPANIGILTEANVYLENPAIPGANIIKDEIFGREAELTFSGERSVEGTFEVIQKRIADEMK